MYPGIELRLLRYAVVVAEELHFTRAALKLHVAQPSLSKQIKDLEAELGTALFERDKRHVRLTPAGAAFVKEARQALTFSERARQAALAASRRGALGYSPYINYDLLRRARTVLARHSWILVSAFTLAQMEMIRLGSLDAGLVTLPVEGDDLRIEPVLAEPLLAALPSRHRLVMSKHIRLTDLNGIPWIAGPREMHPLLHDKILSACRHAGLELNAGQEVTTFAEGMAMVAEGLGFSFARSCYAAFRCAGVAFKPIEGDPLIVETGIATRLDSASQAAAALIAELGRRPSGNRRPEERSAA